MYRRHDGPHNAKSTFAEDVAAAEAFAGQAASIDEIWFRHPDGSIAGHEVLGARVLGWGWSVPTSSRR